MSITPCGDHTQLSSRLPCTLRYLPPTPGGAHPQLPPRSPSPLRYSPPPPSSPPGPREKLTRHWSPSRGGTGAAVSSLSPFHGQATSTDQPRSVSRESLSVPSTWT